MADPTADTRSFAGGDLPSAIGVKHTREARAMIRTNSPFEFLYAYTELFAAASEVVAMRTGQMLAGTRSGTDATERVTEKAAAFSDAAQGAAIAAITGDPRRVAMAMLAPYQEQVALNVARLRA
jgi:hypothetical protein